MVYDSYLQKKKFVPPPVKFEFSENPIFRAF